MSILIFEIVYVVIYVENNRGGGNDSLDFLHIVCYNKGIELGNLPVFLFYKKSITLKRNRKSVRLNKIMYNIYYT